MLNISSSKLKLLRSVIGKVPQTNRKTFNCQTPSALCNTFPRDCLEYILLLCQELGCTMYRSGGCFSLECSPFSESAKAASACIKTTIVSNPSPGQAFHVGNIGKVCFVCSDTVIFCLQKSRALLLRYLNVGLGYCVLNGFPGYSQVSISLHSILTMRTGVWLYDDVMMHVINMKA